MVSVTKTFAALGLAVALGAAGVSPALSQWNGPICWGCTPNWGYVAVGVPIAGVSDATLSMAIRAAVPPRPPALPPVFFVPAVPVAAPVPVFPAPLPIAVTVPVVAAPGPVIGIPMMCWRSTDDRGFGFWAPC